MFGRKGQNSKQAKIESVIGSNMTIEGIVVGGGSIRIEGVINGGMSLTGDVYVGEKGKVDGDVRGNNIVVAGEITGSVHAAGRLVVESTGRLVGDINALKLVVSEGAQFRGHCLVGDCAQANTVPEGSEAAEGLSPRRPGPGPAVWENPFHKRKGSEDALPPSTDQPQMARK